MEVRFKTCPYCDNRYYGTHKLRENGLDIFGDGTCRCKGLKFLVIVTIPEMKV